MPEQGCDGDSTEFAITNATKTISSWNWTFGDTQSGANTSSVANPKHLYTTANTYTVKVDGVYSDGTSYSLDTTITINSLPPSFEFFGGIEDTTICPGTKLLLDPYDSRYFTGTVPENVTYLWYPTGDTTRTIEVDSMGCYSVEIFNEEGCSVTDRINVKICGQSQQSTSNWYFGSNAGISFSGGSASVITDGKLDVPEGTSTISDENGNLLFYTDGQVIYDKNGDLMGSITAALDSIKMGGSLSSTQAALIVPEPSCRGCITTYYVFTTRDVNDSTKCLEYSVVDMRLNNGNGLITQKNVTVQCNITERLTSVMNPADSTYWLLTHEYGSNNLILKRITANGVEDASTISIGIPETSEYQGEGQIKFSNDGTKIGLVVPGSGTDHNYVEIYNFGDSTGTITSLVTLDLGLAPPTVYGIEFSPDGTKVYITLKGDGDSTSVLLQYDLTSGDSTIIAASKLVISTSTEVYGALQYAADGKIYMAIEGSSSLGVINDPDGTTLTEIDFEEDGFSLGGKTSGLGLPNFVQSDIEPPTGPGISVDGLCFGDTTSFSSGPICDPLEDTYQWDFGDGTTSTQSAPTHVYAAANTYTVTLRQTNACKDTTMTYQVTINPTPDPNLGTDITKCATSVELDSKVTLANSQYVWMRDGTILDVPSTASKITVDTSGTYIVLVALGECSDSDTITVSLLQPPSYQLQPDTSFCAGGSVQLSAESGGTAYQWSNGETTQQITVNQSGTYSVNVTIPQNGIDCVVSDTINVSVLPVPTVNVGSALSICANNAPVQLAASPTGGSWSGTGVDSTGLFTPSTQIVGTQTLIYSVTAANGCIGSAAKQVTVAVAPVFSLGPDQTYCADSTVTLSAPDTTGARYLWSTGATTVSISPTASGSYAVTMIIGSCRGSDTVAVTILPLPNVSVQDQASLCVADNQTVRLDAGGNYTMHYYWSPTGDTTRAITVTQVGVYTVEVQNTYGCTETHNINVVDLCEAEIYVPDIFTPNGDGQNDDLHIVTKYVLDQDYELRIYNRWGELIFRTTDKNERWDGKYKGRDFPPQSYAWLIQYRSQYFPERGISTVRGAVMVAK
ncbi:MAG: gliding motility-associated C-terminal domain-containing protein [Siphonobacter sp.]